MATSHSKNWPLRGACPNTAVILSAAEAGHCSSNFSRHSLSLPTQLATATELATKLVTATELGTRLGTELATEFVTDTEPDVKVLRAVADRHVVNGVKVSIANVATRWVLEQPIVASAIVGVRLGHAEHIDDNKRYQQPLATCL